MSSSPLAGLYAYEWAVVNCLYPIISGCDYPEVKCTKQELPGILTGFSYLTSRYQLSNDHIKIPFRSSNVEGFLLLSGGAMVSFICRATHYSYDKCAGWNKNMIFFVLVGEDGMDGK